VPGVPGAGLSGLFYVISALVALVVELAATLRGRSSFARWLVVIRLSSLAAGVVLSINLVYSVVKFIFPDAQPQPEVVAASGASTVATTSQPLHEASLELLPVAPVLMTVGTLALLLAVTFLVGLAARGRGIRGRQALAPSDRLETDPEEASEAIAA
jgi:hypothetical protein